MIRPVKKLLALALFLAPLASHAVMISAGSSIQSAINAHPAGTVFNLAAGTWTNQQFTPKFGNQFIGDPGGGTILDGSDSTSFIYSSNGTVDLNVRFERITVQNYGINSAGCSLGAIHGTKNWTFVNATFRENNCTGLNLGPDSKVLGGKYLNNGHAGIQGGSPSHRVLIEGAEIGGNNTRQDDPTFDAAGVKFAGSGGTDSVTFRNNYVHDNYGPGLWCDIGCTNFLAEGNTVVNNYYTGIFYEISPGPAIIRNNVANGNGHTLAAPQISVLCSNSAEVHGNNVKATSSGRGILMAATVRADALPVEDNNFHDNTVTFTSTSDSRYGFANFGGPTGTGNVSNNNKFFVVNTSNSHFYWNTSSASTFASHQSTSGQDANSTIQTGDGSVAGNTEGCPALTGCTPPAVSPAPPPVVTHRKIILPGRHR